MKTCSKCKRELPVAAFGKNRLGKGGLRSRCRDCESESNANYYAANREKMRASGAAYRAANPEKGRARNAAHYAANREKVLARKAASRVANPEKMRARGRAWAASHKEEIAASNAAYNAAHKEEIAASHAAYRASHKEEECARGAAYRGANPEKIRARKARRRARKLNLPTEDFTRLEILERDGWICQVCGEPILQTLAYPHPRSASLDHTKPLSKGGHHTRANTQATHLVCNVRKNATYKVAGYGMAQD